MSKPIQVAFYYFVLLMASTSLSQAVSCTGSAIYRLTFKGEWTAKSHPEDFPSENNPHFSRVFGCTHNASYVMWRPGINATRGVQLVAEKGLDSINKEMDQQISLKTVLAKFQGRGISNIGSTTVDSITANSAYPLVSAISKVNPSPDWFVGVHDYSLCNETTGKWIEKRVKDLSLYDSGTDSALRFVQNDTKLVRRLAVPHVPIFLLDNTHEGSLKSNETTRRFGTFTFEKTFDSNLQPSSSTVYVYTTQIMMTTVPLLTTPSLNILIQATMTSKMSSSAVLPSAKPQSTDKIPKGRCLHETTGENAAQGIFVWKTIDGDGTSFVECPYGSSGVHPDLRGEPQAERFCRCDRDDDESCTKPSWNEPETEWCDYRTFNNSKTTQELSNLLQASLSAEKPLVNISEELVDLTGHAAAFQPDDVILTVLTLEDIVYYTIEFDETDPNIVRVVDNLLSTPADVLVESQNQTKSSTRILLVLDKYLENVPKGRNVTQNERNIAVHSTELNATNFQGAGVASVNKLQNVKNGSDFVVYQNESAIQPLVSQVSLTMPKFLFKNLNITSKTPNQRIVFIVHRKTLFFQSLTKTPSDSDIGTERKRNSFVITGSVKGHKLKNLKDPVISTYRPLEKGVDKTTACVFWDFTLDNGLGDWSTVGCTYKGTRNGVVTCHCNHLTNFAILMDVYIGNHIDDKALSIISYIGCAVSLVGLILTIITILIFKDLRSKVPNQILLNFCIALTLTLIVFLAAAERSKTSSLASCRVGAIALHYFVLAVFVWMGIQAFNMYLSFVKVIPKHRSHFFLKCCLVGWGLPALIVIITAASAIKYYGDETFCRLQDLPFQLAFLTPVLIILVANAVAFVLILRSLLTSGTKVTADKRVSGLTQVRRGAAILVVLGLTWIFGVFAIKDAKLVFQYLFSIFNSTQGLLVFIFYCVLSVETRKKYKRLFHGVGKGKESDTGHTGHHRYHGSTTDSKLHTGKDTASNNVSTNTSTNTASPCKLEMTLINTDQMEKLRE